MTEYQLNINHNINDLGNVLAVATDRRIQACENEITMYYQAQGMKSVVTRAPGHHTRLRRAWANA